MYGSGGGLFGDLPTAKNEPRRSKPGNDEDASEANDSCAPASSAGASSSGPDKKKPVSLVGALGVAGTTMAFVPAALRARKRQANQPQGQRPAMNRTSSGGLELSAKKAKTVSSGETISTVGEAPPSSSYVEVVSSEVSNATTQKKTFDVHASTAVDTATEKELDRGRPAGEGGALENDGGNLEARGKSKDEERQESNAESESLRRLHESVTDPYDPHVPNDYLAYRERKKAEVVREEMERKALEQLELQRKMRERIEEERRKAEASGDVDQIVKSRLGPQDGYNGAAAAEGTGMGRGRGRGRGRGMTNLPAWLVKKQQEEKEKASVYLGGSTGAGASVGAGSGAKGQFDDARESSLDPLNFDEQDTSGRLIVLSNMVAPGEVDDELPDEVKEECENTCGPVEVVKVQDALLPSWPQVRVFVLFKQSEHAAKASALFHGRKFGERKISAHLASEAENL